MDRKIRYYALCINRHRTPGAVDGAIFPKKINLQDIKRIDETTDRLACQLKLDGAELVLYVSGAQYPLVSVINSCIRRKVKLTLMHYNPETEEYYEQKVNTLLK